MVDDALSPDSALGIELSRNAYTVGGANWSSAYQQLQTRGDKASWFR